MQQFLDTVLKVVQTVNSYLTDYVLIFLLVGVGILYTIATKFVQVRCFSEGLKKVFGNFKLMGGKNKSGMSSFQALATAIAAQVGTGNIVGASGAILLGGPGAIFWMWVIAFFGMATNYGEAVLAQETRVVDADGTVHGGPVYYIRKVFTGAFGKFLSVFFSIAAILALGFMGSMVQSNSIAEACNTAFGVPQWVIGAVIAAISVFIFIGGINRIAAVTEKMVPFMAMLFLIGGVIILGINYKELPATFGLIFKYAFTPVALLGGSAGAAIKMAISQGAKRGLFSNEAGMGSTPHAHALANVEKPHDQGVVAMIAVFIDTFVVLTLTALVVISSLYLGDGIFAGRTGIDFGGEVAKSAAMQLAYTETLPAFFGNFGNIFVAICLLFFAYSTIISWNLFGKLNIQWLFKNNKIAEIAYAVISIAFIFAGSVLKNDLVWELTDFFNYLMVIPNVIAMIALVGIVKKASNNSKKLAK